MDFDTLQDVGLRKLSWSADARMIANILKVAIRVRKADSDWFVLLNLSEKNMFVTVCSVVQATNASCPSRFDEASAV